MPDFTEHVRKNLQLDGASPEQYAEAVEEVSRQLDDAYKDALNRGLSSAKSKEWALAHIPDWKQFSAGLRSSRRYCIPLDKAVVQGVDSYPNVQSFRRNVLYAVRTFLRSPGFTLVAVLTIALGVGANTAIFTVMDAVLFRPLPYPEPQSIVRIWEDPGSNTRNLINPRNFADWRDRNTSFDKVAAFTTASLNLSGTGEAERVLVGATTPELFSILGTTPAMGRSFQENEDKVVLISSGLWQRRFGGSLSVIGQPITLDGENSIVIGVLPETFGFQATRTPAQIDIWSPLMFTPQMLNPTQRGSHYLRAVARLRPGVTVDSAQSDLSRIYDGLRQQYPSLKRWNVHVVSMIEDTVGDVRGFLYILFGVVVFVLMIACANVANMLLARGTNRQREIAVRMALGADRNEIFRQLLTESTVLSIAGGVCGVGVAYGMVLLLRSLTPAGLPRLEHVAMDYRVLMFAVSVSLLSSILFGLFPALHAARKDLNLAIKEGNVISGTRKASKMRNLFVVAEVALALILLVGAGLLSRSLAAVTRVDPGFDASGLLTMRISLASQRYPDIASQIRYYRQLMQNIGAVGDISSAALISDPPISGQNGLWNNGFLIEGKPEPPPGEGHFAFLRWITPDYFRTIGVVLNRGRQLEERDNENLSWVVVVDEAFAAEFFPGENPLGKRIVVQTGERRSREIIGVVGNVRQTSLSEPAGPHMYVPYYQTPVNYASIIARTRARPEDAASSLRAAVRNVDANQAVFAVTTLEQVLEASVAGRRFNATLLVVFALLAMILAIVGIYGVISYSIVQRFRELGLRIALGASRADILILALLQGLSLAMGGTVLGLVGAVALSRLLAAQLYGVTPTDPLTFAATATLFLLVAAAACYIPARRASRMDPMVALRD